MDHFHSDLLPGFEEADPSCIAGIEVGLAGLNTPSALQKGFLIHHHLIAGKICEVYVVYLTIDEVCAVHQYLQLPTAGMQLKHLGVHSDARPVIEDST